MFKTMKHPLQETFDATGSTGGGAVVDGSASPSPAPSPAPAPAPAASSMLDAISQGLDSAAAPAPAVSQPRDEAGRFTFKDSQGNAVDAQGALAPNQTEALAAQAAAAAKLGPDGKPLPEAEEDLTQMPEGLGGKAQERFHKLANANKELTQQLDQAAQQISYIQQTFQQHDVKQEQFEQAVSVIGMINRGDLAGAQRVLMEQLQQISLITGQSLQVDPLADFPDLRQKVNSLLISEEDAIALARANQLQTQQQQAQQRQSVQVQQQRQQQEQAQQAQQQRQQATNEVDAFCRQMQGSDLDYSAIEAKLLPVLPQILEGVPPQRWASVVKTQYQLIKEVAGGSRAAGGAQASAQALRATGQAAPSAAPRTMMEAMFGSS